LEGSDYDLSEKSFQKNTNRHVFVVSFGRCHFCQGDEKHNKEFMGFYSTIGK
jgi:hypothetical protein